MAIEVTARDLADLGDQRFEQLIASIVLAEEPRAERHRIVRAGIPDVE